jgi:pyruvate formate lyase activating enzyme
MGLTAPIVACSRHRMLVDGQGVTTLVCFHGCPLRCHWCLNPFTLDSNIKGQMLTPQALYEKVRIDELYFLATGGGITFGGGEPLLYSDFLQEFHKLCGPDWHLCAETSLNVPWENVATAADCIDYFYIDCKDTDPDIYHRYTSQDNARMLSNLRRLLEIAGPERITVRIPLIPEFNTKEDQIRSQKLLQSMGVVNFDLFTYRTDILR